MGRAVGAARRVAPAVSLLALAAGPLAAQRAPGLVERLNLDRLRLSAFGGAVGPVWPARAEPTQLYSLHTDYGEFTPRWRVAFVASYWSSRYRPRVVQTFVDSLNRRIVGAAAGRIEPSRITLSDITIGTDLRWTPQRATLLRPFAGGGIGAHIVNSEGRLIDGTFVEQLLDDIAAGFAGFVGVEVVPIRNISLSMQARFDLLSGSRFASLRAGGSYVFAPPRREPAGAPAGTPAPAPARRPAAPRDSVARPDSAAPPAWEGR